MTESLSRKTVLFVSMLGAFLTPFMASSINIALPSIGEDFKMNAVMLSWTATSYLLAAAIFLVPFGRLADIYGRKRIYLYGILTFTVSSALCGAAPFLSALIVFRVLQGIGSAMIFGTGIAILTSVFKPEERGSVLGLNVAITYLGLSLGPVLSGFLTQHLGWRSIFYVTVPLGAVAAVFIVLKMKQEWLEASDESFDLIGSIIYGASLTAVMYGFTLLPKLSGGVVVFAGIIGIAAFGLFESRRLNPVLSLGLFKGNRVFVFSSAAALVNYSATYAVSFLLSLYLQYIKGMSPQLAGLVLVAQPAMQALLSPFTGMLSDRVEARKVATAGMGITTVSLVSFVLLNEVTSVPSIILYLIVLGAGLALFSSPNTNAIMSSVEKRYYGVASGIVGTMRLLGQMLSMGITTLVMAMHVGVSRITPELHPEFIQSLKISFIVLSVLCLAGTFASFARGNTAAGRADKGTV